METYKYPRHLFVFLRADVSRGISREINKFNASLGEDPTVAGWLRNSVQPSTAGVYLRNFGGWYQWLGEEGRPELRDLSPGDLIEKQRQLSRAYYLGEILKPERKMILFEVVRYTEERGAPSSERPGWSTKYKRKIYSSVRSFFLYYLEKEEVPDLDKGEKRRLKGRKGTKKELDIETLRDIIDDCNPMYKAVFSCMLASGMGIGEILEWSDTGLDELREALENPIRWEGVEIVEIFLAARKLHIEEDFYVYIGGSALEFLKAWLKHREDMERRFNLERAFPNSIFVNNTYKPLKRSATQFYYTSKIHRLKIKRKVEGGSVSTRYNLNMHQIRSIFRTRWQKSDTDGAVGEYFMGHVEDKNGYNQIHNDRDYRIGEYVKGLSWVDIKKIDVEQQSEELEATKRKLEEITERFEAEHARVSELERRDRRREERLEQLMERMDNIPGSLLSDIRIDPEIRERLPEGTRLRIAYNGAGEGVLYIEPAPRFKTIMLEDLDPHSEPNEKEERDEE